jgi:hypothetical protein
MPRPARWIAAIAFPFALAALSAAAQAPADADGGETWSVWFDGRYVRAGSDP